MSGSGGIFLVLLAALAANAPFFSPRILFVLRPGSGVKNLAWRLLEVVILYFCVGALARFMEARAGQIYPQNWEFYAITFSLFVVLGYPGFVYRYLWKRNA